MALENVLGASDLGLRAPGALTWDAGSEALVVEDRISGKALRVEPLGRRLGVTNRDVTADLAARHPITRNLFVLDASSGVLRELDWFGRTISQRDLGQFRLRDVTSITFAPSADQTDDAESTSLFLTAGSGVEDGESTEAGIYEMSLTEPLMAASLAAAATTVTSRLQTIDTSDWSPASPDPSGVAYSQGLNRLIVADGEVDEQTGAGFHDVNVWLSTLAGAEQPALNTEDASPSNNEPVGAAFDPARNELYICKDGDESHIWVYELSGSTFTQVRHFSVADFAGDAEGLAFGAGALFIADGSNKHVWRIDGQGNGVDGNDPHDGFDTEGLGIADPEGIGFHSGSGNLWVLSRREKEGILEVTPDGTPISVAHYDTRPVSPGGLEVAPSSADATKMSLWVVDRGVDNGDNSNENDGKLYEYSLAGGGGTPPPPPPPGGNVLSNGGFEQASGGSPDDWTPTDSRFTQSSAVVRSDSFAGLHSANNDSGYKVMQTAPVVSGANYQFTGWVNAPQTTDRFRIVIKLMWRTDKGKISTQTIEKITQPTDGWTDVTANLPAPSNATNARVMMVLGSLSTQVYVDDFSLAAAP